MFGAAAAYLVAISAMLFCALSALTLIHTVKHLDPPEAPPSAKQVPVHEQVAVSFDREN
jgi:prenyltransferase beta subunit